MKKFVVGGVIAVLIITGLLATLLLRPATPQQKDATNTPNTSNATQDDVAPSEVAADGRYIPYNESLISESGYAETILFFHAPWCPECRAFEQSLTSEAIPDGVQILKIDYDSNNALKKKYGVTLQTTFVKVDTLGEKESLWVGYGKDKSLTAILENT